jgi:hypothetical protein
MIIKYLVGVGKSIIGESENQISEEYFGIFSSLHFNVWLIEAFGGKSSQLSFVAIQI